MESQEKKAPSSRANVKVSEPLDLAHHSGTSLDMVSDGVNECAFIQNRWKEKELSSMTLYNGASCSLSKDYVSVYCSILGPGHR